MSLAVAALPPAAAAVDPSLLHPAAVSHPFSIPPPSPPPSLDPSSIPLPSPPTPIVIATEKFPKSLFVSCGIEPDEEGSAGIRLTARGSVTTCAYGVDMDDRTHFSSVGWKNFLVGKNLRVGHAILITIRNTHCPGLRMMVVVDII
nr:predicted protein [Triticum aestivum]